MVIEDHDILREATVKLLFQEGYEVIGVVCAEDVDDTPVPRTPDLYVVDLNLPGEDGLSLAVNPQEFLAALSSLANRLKRESLQGGLSLDDQKSMLRGPGGESKLAESEVRLLVALASAREMSLERWQVAIRLNPNNEDISADNLQNRVSLLRKKIAMCGIEGESLKAVRGSGYRLCVPLVII